MKAGIFRLIRYSAVLACLVSLAYASYSAGHYLRTAQRFEVRQISVSGLRRVQESQVIERADFDIGTNVFAVDLDGIRERVEGLQWVHHAVVQRVLPNEIKVSITEREPIGLARIKGEIYEFDSEGVVLDPDPMSMPSFPVLDGLSPTDAKRNKERVRLYRKVLEELGQNELSEIHINAAGEVSVVSSADPLLVSIGADSFHARWVKFLQLRSQIQSQYPEAVRVDLRFRNQVIVSMRGEETENNVIWDAEKKLL